MRGGVLLACLMAVATLGSRIAKEEQVPLGLTAARALVHDTDAGVIWVGGTAAQDVKQGQIVGVRVKDKTVIKGPTTNAPVQCGGMAKGKIYWGQSNGGLSVYDIQKNAVTFSIKPVIEMLEIVYITMNKDGNGMWMAFRKATPGMDNWCFQQYFTITDVDTNPTLKPSWEAFSGRHPGPCTGLHVDFENAQVYYTDATIRGRWMGIFQAFTRHENSWNNFNYLEKSIVFNKAQYILSRTGKVDSWTYDNFLAGGEPAADRSLQVDLGDRFSFELWRTLFADPERESLWVASEDGELVQFLASPTEFKQVAAMKSKSPRKYGEGMVLGSALVLVDLQNDEDSQLVFTHLASSCILGDGMECYCRAAGDNSDNICTVPKSADVGKSFKVPPKTTVNVGGDLTLGQGATMVIPFSSKVSVKGKIIANDASLQLQDAMTDAGQFTLLEGSVDGKFRSVKVDFMSGLMRLFTCLQFPSVAVAIEPDVTGTIKFFGLKKCATRTQLIIFYVALVASIAAVAYFVFIKTRAEINQEHARKTI